MGDIVKAFHGVMRRYKDMGDGTFAEVVSSSSSGGSGTTTGVAKVTFATFTSAAGAQTLSIPAGALEVSLANTGASAATFSAASMAPATTALKPVTDPDGATLNFVAPSGYTLEAMTVVAPVGVTIDYMVIKP
jgi:hypothetical protein